MRKILVAIVLLISSINLQSSEPVTVAKLFIDNFAKGNIEEVKKYASENTKIVLSFLDTQIGSMPTYPNYEFKAIKDSVADKNTVYIEYLTPDNSIDKVKVVRENNEWKVALGSE